MGGNRGYLAIVLHAHLPFVRHPENPRYFEENWLYEAITESYAPLIGTFLRLAEDGVPFRATMSVTPPLLSMLTDPLLRSRYRERLLSLVDLAEKEVTRTRPWPDQNRVAHLYNDHFRRVLALWDRYGGDLAVPLAELDRAGRLELITSAATHGFLPLMDVVPEAVRAQVQVGVNTFRRIIGKGPAGFWLPECAYHPGHERFLAEAGIKFFITDAHGILHAAPRPKYANFAPVFTRAGVAAFGRDLESSKQVWSASEGYPGDYWYRDFYRDIGYDLDEGYVRPYLPLDEGRAMTGIKYHRITGHGDHKAIYDPGVARERAAEHAGNFMFNRERQVEWLAGHMDRPPIIVAPYDAELFGHWWFEGPQWLDFLFRKVAFDQKTIEPITLSEYLRRHPKNQVCRPSMSTWGYKGYNEVWLEGSNDWIYPHLHAAANRMVELARRFREPSPLERRALAQAGRELLLAQASDWAFIMKTGTTVSYAERRTKAHLANFTKLHDGLLGRQLDSDAQWLAALETSDNVFPDLDYRVYA